MNRKSKVLVLSLLSSLVLFAGVPSYAEAAAPVPPAIATYSAGDLARADDIRWVYQTFGGVTYRRQYNFTKDVWIGGWERVG